MIIHELTMSFLTWITYTLLFASSCTARELTSQGDVLTINQDSENLSKPFLIMQKDPAHQDLQGREFEVPLSKEQKKKLRKERKKERRENKRLNRKKVKVLTSIAVPQENPGQLDLGASTNTNTQAYIPHMRHELHMNSRQPKQYFPDMTWLANNLTSIWELLQHMQKDIKQIRRNNRVHSQSTLKKLVKKQSPAAGVKSHVDLSSAETTTESCNPDWPVDPMACLDDPNGPVCGGNGKCVCGQCACEAPYYGIHCQCNDHICKSVGGVMCGGAGRGQCRCGSCVCRPDFSGEACECSTSTASCDSGNGVLCSGHGNCQCDRCQCIDGYSGNLCEDSIYSASVCERLKPCVLCKAFGRNYPQCEDCKIIVKHVDELELSQTTCVMINLGCIVKYAYSKSLSPDEVMTVFVPKGMSCPP